MGYHIVLDKNTRYRKNTVHHDTTQAVCLHSWHEEPSQEIPYCLRPNNPHAKHTTYYLISLERIIKYLYFPGFGITYKFLQILQIPGVQKCVAF